MKAKLSLFGEHAIEIDLFADTSSDNLPSRDDVLAWARLARQVRAGIIGENLGFVSECIATYGVLLLVIESGVDHDLALACVTKLLDENLDSWLRSTLPSGREWTIRTVYDGPDLEAVALACQCSIDEVIRLHTSRTYEVEILGFLPGFAYLGSLDPRLQLPRRTSPRSRVAAQSVAIAEQRTAIYPVASPGGWHLLGRALSPRVFDPTQDEALSHSHGVLFAPGDQVRFVAVGESA